MCARNLHVTTRRKSNLLRQRTAERTASPAGIATVDQRRGSEVEPNGYNQSPSSAHHEACARQFADLRSWTVVEVYDLENFSGKTVWNHPETKRMLADIRRGHISGLIFSKLARLAILDRRHGTPKRLAGDAMPAILIRMS